MKRVLVLTSATFSHRVNAWSVVTTRSSKTHRNVLASAEESGIIHCRFPTSWSFPNRQTGRVNFDNIQCMSHPHRRSNIIIPNTTVLSRCDFPQIDRGLRMATRLASSSSSGSNQLEDLGMEHLYMAWTLEDDEFLYQNMNEDIPKLASKLGRGLRGVESRMAKLKDVNSPAYQRLFVENKFTFDLEIDDNDKTQKLTPVSEVMRRIKWDDLLNPDDFSVEYFDRVQERVMSVPFGAKNDSVKGKEEMFVFAIPEHRIMTIKYKERIVWDKKRRIDCVFGSMHGNGETIYKVLEHYDEWKRRREELEAYNKQRQRELVAEMKRVLGEQLFTALKTISSDLQHMSTIGTVTSEDIQNYVGDAISLFRKARRMTEESSLRVAVVETSDIPQNDIEALHLFSSLVALLPDDDLRERILLEIYIQVRRMDPTKKAISAQRDTIFPKLADLNEDELIESFVRGSGAGGQKINKTANKVLLIHAPTQLRVECQDTRSLQQNRKIARKRLKLKLDEYLNGSESITQKKIAKKIHKKQKVKAKNKARLKKKMNAQEQENRVDMKDNE